MALARVFLKSIRVEADKAAEKAGFSPAMIRAIGI